MLELRDKAVASLPQTAAGVFATTHWSIVLAAGEAKSAQSHEELWRRLCRAYWYPLYASVRRDMVLYLGRRVCGLKLRELAKAVGIRNDAVVATNTRRYERRLQTQRREQNLMKEVSQMLNCKI